GPVILLRRTRLFHARPMSCAWRPGCSGSPACRSSRARRVGVWRPRPPPPPPPPPGGGGKEGGGETGHVRRVGGGGRRPPRRRRARRPGEGGARGRGRCRGQLRHAQ